MKPRILNVEPEDYCAKAREILRSFAEVEEECLTRLELISSIGKYDGLIVRLGHRIDKEVLSRASLLKVIATATTGLGHIDVSEAEHRDISIISLKGERRFLDTVHATSEHAWGLLLALVRKIPSATNHVIGGGWDRNQFKGMELANHSLGIVGYGRLGSIVARYGLAFGMKVMAYDTLEKERFDDIQFVGFEELLSLSDIISLHVHLDETTRGLISTDEFNIMKHGCLLINTSRGEIIDESALLKALNNGRIGGAALDVLSNETQYESIWSESNPLIKYAKNHDNLIITPHIGGATRESMKRTEIFIAEKLSRFFSRVVHESL